MAPTKQLVLEYADASRSIAPEITIIQKRNIKTTAVYDTYWRFAAKRQDIFFLRYLKLPQPWTDDPILRGHKFTNAYRASDRVSQYLIRNVIYSSNFSIRDLFFRILIFKIFNRIETWQHLENAVGDISFDNYSYSEFDRVLTALIDSGERIYSAAYIMPSGGKQSTVLGRKHRMHLKMIESMIADNLPERLSSLNRMDHAYHEILKYPTIGPFLAYQYLIDINYSPICDFNEMDFIVPGPGAKDGIKKCFPDLSGLTEADIIKYVTDKQETEFTARGITFKSLWGRPLQLIDCQNLFCEVDKYSRIYHPDIQGVTKRSKIKQKLVVNKQYVELWYPPKWGLNEKISSGVLP